MKRGVWWIVGGLTLAVVLIAAVANFRQHNSPDALLERELTLIIEEYGFNERGSGPHVDITNARNLTFDHVYEIDALSQSDLEIIAERIKNNCTGCESGGGWPMMAGLDGSPVSYQTLTGESYRTVVSIVLVGSSSVFADGGPRDGNATISIERRQRRGLLPRFLEWLPW